MTYQFPHITHIDEVLEAIAGREEFVVKHDEENGYKVVNYLVNFEDTFPPVNDRRTALLRECRGITFDATTGKVISRKFHKFFNVNERPETLAESINWSIPHVILKKLDGSMLTPMLVNDKVRWCTKMGLTQVAVPVDEFVSTRPHYEEFARYHMSMGHTPIFEWCSHQQRIVIDYAEERLVLLALRDNVTGEYLSYENLQMIGERAGIPVVEYLPGSVENVQKFMAEAHDLQGEEGYIVRFETGHMLKVKGAWYCQMHKTMEHLNHEKDVIRLILDEKLDDAKAFLPERLQVASDNFAKDLYKNIGELADKLYWMAQASYDNFNGSKKKFAEEVLSGDKFKKAHSKFLFRAFENLDAGVEGVREDIINHVKNSTSTQTRVNESRHLFGGVHWRDYSGTIVLDS